MQIRRLGKSIYVLAAATLIVCLTLSHVATQAGRLPSDLSLANQEQPISRCDEHCRTVMGYQLGDQPLEGSSAVQVQFKKGCRLKPKSACFDERRRCEQAAKATSKHDGGAIYSQNLWACIDRWHACMDPAGCGF